MSTATSGRAREYRFWSKVNGGDVDTCWEWTAAKTHGYGVFWAGDRLTRSHRWAYENLRVDLPDALHLDHLCRNRACVNPWHLEPVTPKVNAERGAWGMRTHCPQGHAYDERNTSRRGTRDGRECIACRSAAKESKRQERRALLAEDPSLAEHGRLTTYNDWMCRCQPCRDALAAYARERRARHIGRAA